MNYSEQELELRRNFDDLRRMHGKEALLEEYDEKVLKLKIPSLSAYFALIGGPNAKKHRNIVLKSNNLEAIYELSDKYSECLEYILDSHNVKYNLGGLKRILEQSTHVYGRAFSSNNYAEVDDMKERAARHVESISKSKDKKGLLDFLSWYVKALERKVTYHHGLPNDSWSNTIYTGRNILDSSALYFNNIIFTFVEDNNPQQLYMAITKLESIRGHVSHEMANSIDTEQLHKALAKTKDPEYNYLILKEINNESDELFLMHEEAIIKSKDPKYNYLTAKEFNGVDILKHQEVVIESGSAEYCYLFALNIKGADVKRLEEVVINSKNAKYCYLFAKNIKEADVKRLGEAVIESKHPKYNYLFARDITNANKEEHCKAVAKSDDAKYNYLCCLLDDSSHYENKVAVIQSENVEYNYYLAFKFPDDSLYDEYLKVVIGSGRTEYIAELNNLKPVMIQNIDKKLKTLKKSL